jgi:hypothetical protein
MITFRATLVVLVGLLGGCGTGIPRMHEVHREFLDMHPSCAVRSMELRTQSLQGELFAPHAVYAQYYISYLCEGDQGEHLDVWHYHRAAESWVVGKREKVR